MDGGVAQVPVSGATIELERRGRGSPVVLLHGYPQTRRCWSRLIEPLAERHAVVALDLRGYGGSSAPPSDPEHVAYSKEDTTHCPPRWLPDVGAGAAVASCVGGLLA